MKGGVFLGIGECMVELSDAQGGLLRQSFAGDVFNTLWYAKRALPHGWSTRFLSAVGVDPLSDGMADFIAGAGIETGDIRRIPDRRPGLYMIHLDAGERSFSYWRDRSAARLLAADAAHLDRAIGAAQVVYLSGITLAILSGDDLETLLARLATARAAGAIIAFDPNIRPALWDDATRMRAMIERAAETATIILPSFDDEASAFGDADAGATLARYAARGADLVVVKNGAGDVSVKRGNDTATPYPTTAIATPVDTTGAGDSFNGAFLAEYVTSGDVAASVAAGQACAAQVIGHHGALIN